NRLKEVRTVDPTQAAVQIREFDIDRGGTDVLHPYGEIDYKTSGGHDSYNALQLSVMRRSARGLTMNAQYTLGRSFGNSQGSNESQSASNNARALSEYDFENGYNTNDVRHNFNVSAVYELPFGARKAKDLGPVGNMLLGNWEIGTITNARS